MASVTLYNLTLSYARHPAVHHVSGSFASGSLTAITGPNGGGKTTLLRAIAGLHPIDEGTIQSDCSQHSIGWLPQITTIEREAPLTALELVCSGFWQQTGLFGAITASMKSRAHTALAEAGLEGANKRTLQQFSAGQFRRLLFARLIVQDAPLILLDEPFAGIDATTTTHLLRIIHRWHKEGRTVLCVLHEEHHIRAHFPDCLVLARECIAWEDTTSALARWSLAATHPFTPAAEDAECKQAI